MIKHITCDIVAHNKQRYPTAGDYFPDPIWPAGRGVVFRISDTGNLDDALCVFIHELIEWRLTQKHGITQQQIDAFDFQHVRSGEPGEPGDHPNCPYRLEHGLATIVERLCAETLGISWKEYEDRIDSLDRKENEHA